MAQGEETAETVTNTQQSHRRPHSSLRVGQKEAGRQLRALSTCEVTLTGE